MESPIQRSRLWKISFWKLYYSWYRHWRKDIYAKFYFENCIPHTDIDKKIFMHKFFLKIIFLIWTSTKDIDRKSSPIKSTRGTPAGWFYENTFGIAKGYLDWSRNGKVSGASFIGYRSVIMILGRNERYLKRVIWSCRSTCRHICYIDWSSHTSVGPSIIINLVYTLLKHFENTAERPPVK